MIVRFKYGSVYNYEICVDPSKLDNDPVSLYGWIDYMAKVARHPIYGNMVNGIGDYCDSKEFASGDKFDQTVEEFKAICDRHHDPIV